jgi:mRNA interferase MazF
MKDFDSWNEIKKQIDTSERMDALFFYEKELWWVNMGVNVGDEENGKGRDFIRPILIIKKHNRRCFLSVALSTVNKDDKYHFTFSVDNRYISAILSQIKLMDSKRLIKRIGVIQERDFQELLQATVTVNFGQSPVYFYPQN